MCAKAMTFSDMGWGKVNKGTVEFHNEQWVRAFLMGQMLTAEKSKSRIQYKMFGSCSFRKYRLMLMYRGNLNRMAVKSCFAGQSEKIFSLHGELV